MTALLRSRVRGVAGSPLPVAVLTTAGTATLVLGASVLGAAVVGVLLAVLVPLELGDGRTPVTVTAIAYVGAATVVGTIVGLWVQRRTLLWLVLGRTPTVPEVRRALRLPVDLACVSGFLWGGGAVVLGAVAWSVADGGAGLRLLSAVALGGVATGGLTYLLVSRVMRPVSVRALAAHPLNRVMTVGVIPRMLLTWALTVAVPLFGVLLVLVDPAADTGSMEGAVALLVGVALLLGAITTALVGKAVAAPLRRLRECLAEVGEGNLDVHVVVDDAGEIGLLQTGVNSMLAGLREREQIRDLFGRHVGKAVVERALETGVQLGGETRDVVALFVDVTGSTTLATEVEPTEVVRLLNSLFAVVVDAVEDEGGLVNKFEGDAALCVFGAPTPLDDPATAALRVARRIRDEVRAAGELEIGIGVSAGPVVAGQVGARSRFEYTVIGDAVNEAARLTDAAKETRGKALAAAAVVDASTADERAHWRRRAPISLRGRTSPTEIYELHGRQD